ncbi:hypothetical protein T4B_2980 [Trichinella pseudospiralis]|uniref:Uncharacterized protein n=1 Tax=Trichinella pseudospiralis TaxID=6337 RepID=A0A0V1GYH7_TRIPS|nr:hypothetical protein T4A_7759 [Trichinella pseudospiralis]KRZ03371.1 hypothetical protein T4B_2980 [Trichinella pseudospiralis]KRZ35163.1 hypothetical protein T4C_5419 [Trichinella pseudospiralis]
MGRRSIPLANNYCSRCRKGELIAHRIGRYEVAKLVALTYKFAGEQLLRPLSTLLSQHNFGVR